MPRRKPDRELPSDFVEALESGIRDVLKDPKATATQRMQAVRAGVDLELMRHKMKGTEDGSGSFFSK
jgi:hypothetical protein